MSVKIDRKNVNRLAKYSGYVPRRKVARDLYRIPAGQGISGGACIGRGTPSGGESVINLRNALMRGVNLGEFDEVGFVTREELSEVDIAPDMLGAQWKAINACYVLFLSEAQEAAQFMEFEPSEDWASIEKQWRVVGKRRAPAQTADEGKFVARPDREHGDQSFLRAELAEFEDQVAVCWIEVTEGMRVRATLPSGDLAELSLNEGDEFLWSPASHAVKPMSECRSESRERQELREDLEKLSREFREELQTLRTGLDGE